MVKEIPKITTVAALYARLWLIFHALYVHPLSTDQAELRNNDGTFWTFFFAGGHNTKFALRGARN